jgi:hypothetical protein
MSYTFLKCDLEDDNRRLPISDNCGLRMRATKYRLRTLKYFRKLGIIEFLIEHRLTVQFIPSRMVRSASHKRCLCAIYRN